jgi:hypothetical protein
MFEDVLKKVDNGNPYSLPQNYGFLLNNSTNGELYRRDPKSTSLRETGSFESSCVKIN